MGCPAMHRWELKEAQKNQRERLSRVKSSIDTRAPTSQPHLTLYGRDYIAKKKATTEAAFSDLKMIQAIARTMTRKTQVEERKGPVSLNADARKADIYRIMAENHRLLDHIDSVEPFTNVQDMLEEHKFKRRYVINASHTMRMSGHYDEDLERIRREDQVRKEAQMRSTQLRREAAEKMKKTSGSVSLPSLTTVSTVEPSLPPGAKQGATKRGSPAKGWNGPPGESNAFDLRRGAAKQQAKAPKPREAGAGTLARASEPAAARSAAKPSVRFTGAGSGGGRSGALSSSSSSAPAHRDSPSGSSLGGRTPPAALSRDIEIDDEKLTPTRKMAVRKGTPHPSKLVTKPTDLESEPSEMGDGAIEGAELLEEAALVGHGEEDGIVIEDDFVPDPPAPEPTGDAPEIGEQPPEAEEPGDKAAPEEYEDDFDDVAPDEQEPEKAAPKVEEPPEDSFEEAATPVAEASLEEREDSPAEDAPGEGAKDKAEVDAPEANEPEAQEPFMVPVAPTEPPAEEDEDEDYDNDGFDDEDAVGSDGEKAKESDDRFEDSFGQPTAKQDASETFEQSATKEETSLDKDSFEQPSSKEETSNEKEEHSYEKESFESSGEAQESRPKFDAEPPEEEPTVEPTEDVGVSLPERGLKPVNIAQQAHKDAGGEDQGQDEYDDEYEDDFVNENEALASTAHKVEPSFEESAEAFEETSGA